MILLWNSVVDDPRNQMPNTRVHSSRRLKIVMGKFCKTFQDIMNDRLWQVYRPYGVNMSPYHLILYGLPCLRVTLRWVPDHRRLERDKTSYIYPGAAWTHISVLAACQNLLPKPSVHKGWVIWDTQVGKAISNLFSKILVG